MVLLNKTWPMVSIMRIKRFFNLCFLNKYCEFTKYPFNLYNFLILSGLSLQRACLAPYFFKSISKLAYHNRIIFGWENWFWIFLPDILILSEVNPNQRGVEPLLFLKIISPDTYHIYVQSTPDFETLYFGEILFWKNICNAPISSMGL